MDEKHTGKKENKSKRKKISSKRSLKRFLRQNKYFPDKE